MPELLRWDLSDGSFPIYVVGFGFPDGSVVKKPSASAGDARHIGSIGRKDSPRGANGSPLQYSCLFPSTEEPGRLQSMGMQRVIMNDGTHTNSWCWLVFGNWFYYCGSHCRSGEVNPSFVPHQQSATFHSCGRHHCCLWERGLKHPCDFCRLRLSAACKPTLTRSFSSPHGPPLYGTSAVIRFVGSWLCWVREALLQFILEGFPYMCELWFLHLTPQHLQGCHPPSV